MTTWVGAALTTVLLFGCEEDTQGGGGSDGSTSDGSDTDVSTSAPSSTTMSSGSGPDNCVPGDQDCVCLDGACAGTLVCVDNTCLPGPDVDIGDEATALAGVRFPIQFELLADEFSWSQVSGPMVQIDDQGVSPLLVDLPPGAAGQTITLRLTSVRNTIESTDDYVITVVDAQVEDPFEEVDEDEEPPPPLMLGQTEAVEFFGGNAWVASSTEGTLTQVNNDGTVANTYMVGGMPMSLRRGEIPENDDGLDVLYYADPMAQSVNAFVLGNQQVRTITDADENSNPLGTVTYVITADNGDVVFSNGAGGQVFYYDNDSGITRVVAEAAQMGPNPHALTFGPEGFLYVGTTGEVWKVPILGDDIDPDNDEDIMGGPPELYLSIGATTDATLEVDGLVFDGTLNLFAGASGASTLYLARYVADGAADLTNSWTRGGNPLGRFIGLRHGDGDFSDRAVYFATGAEGRIGRVFTGVDRNL